MFHLVVVSFNLEKSLLFFSLSSTLTLVKHPDWLYWIPCNLDLSDCFLMIRFRLFFNFFIQVIVNAEFSVHVFVACFSSNHLVWFLPVSCLRIFCLTVFLSIVPKTDVHTFRCPSLVLLFGIKCMGFRCTLVF